MPPRRKQDPKTGIWWEKRDDGTIVKVDGPGDSQASPSAEPAARGITITTDAGEQTSVGPQGAVTRGDAPYVGVTLREAAAKYERAGYAPEVIARLRAGDSGALAELRPADQSEVERMLSTRRAAAANPTAHAPMPDRAPGLAAELDTRAHEYAPVTRTRGGRPQPEPTHTPLERTAAAVAQPISGVVRGADAASAGLASTIPRQVMPERQAMVDELGETSGLTTPTSIAATMLPMSLPARAASYAARAVPTAANVAGRLGAPLRMLSGAGQAVAGGAAAGGSMAAGQALGDVQRGQEQAGNIPGRIAQGAAETIPTSLAMFPLFAMAQAGGQRAVEALRESPDLGPPILSLEKVGLGTQMPLGAKPPFFRRVVPTEKPAPSEPGAIPFTRKKGPEPEGNIIAKNQRAQREGDVRMPSTPPAADITARGAAKQGLEYLGNKRDTVRQRQGEAVDAYAASPEGMEPVSTQPVLDYVDEAIRNLSDDAGRTVLGAQSAAGRMRGRYGELLEGRPAVPGEVGIPLSEAQRLGIPIADASLKAPRPAPKIDLDVDDAAYARNVAANRSAADAEPVYTAREIETTVEPLIDKPATGAGTVPPKNSRGRRRQGAATAEEVASGGGTYQDADGNFMSAPPGPATRAIPPPPPEAQAAPGEPQIVLMPRNVNFRELEQSRRLLDDAANVSSNTEGKVQAGLDVGVSNVLRGMRDNFKPNAVAPDQPARVAGGKQVTGPAAMMQRHHEELTALDNEFRALGIDPKIDRIDPEDVTLLRSAMNAIRGGDEALNVLGVDDPAMQRALRQAAAHYAYDALYNRGPKVQNTLLTSSEQGAHNVVSLGGMARLYLDPVMKAAAGRDLKPGDRRGLTGSRAGRAGAVAPAPELLERFLDMIGLKQEE